ncbi:enoyl-CoA hydratase [Pseudoalteromonas ruthenica]|uniref:enoyl-CoA hydratase/isomerase family protein n=1 Tax=Pseudoalteromonas ruthenica TaxID=151081 RepID=UPI0011096761|nr:enoyl-CoA hydratase/isomerase family protein [Pseudoalteromonas ruthenica]TLX51677.1 enoyl-CoA hydratase [Pseudoalteromonas ruthenica]
MDELIPLNNQDAEVVFELAQCSNGSKIGLATLNVPKALNALNLNMIRLLDKQLKHWADDDELAFVVLKGMGDKAFCAGGDVVSLHSAMATGEPADYGQTFFSEEYRLDYAIHCYNKPIVVWGDGIIMGGGMGLMAGASHRVVTERSKLAMPEITIGLYPDVGASYFLQKAPDNIGLFLGLTGALMNADDARFAALADHSIDSNKFTALLATLCEQSWGKVAALNHDKLTQLLKKFDGESKTMEKGGLRTHLNTINRMSEYSDLAGKVNYLTGIESDDKWLAKAVKTLNHGCPLSAHLVFEQLKRAQGLSLKACFKMELGMSVTCCEVGEFQEGVRALLIDKDMSPQWQYPSLQEVPESVIERFFNRQWREHPLETLV